MSSSQKKNTEPSKAQLLLKTSLLISIFFLAGLVAPLGYKFLKQSSLFKLQAFRIVQNSNRVSLKDIRSKLKPHLGQSIYQLDLRQIETEIETLPWVKTALVKRFPPNELKIDFLEQKPIATLSLQKHYLLSDNGQLFKHPTKKRLSELPLLSGISPKEVKNLDEVTADKLMHAANALLAHKKLDEPGGAIQNISVDDNNRVYVRFRSGLEIILGSEQYETKWIKLTSILSSVLEKKKVLEYAYLDDYPNKQQVAIKLKK